MDIMELGAIGELIGGVAVIATLVYLSVQIRQSNAIERAETHRSFVRDWNHAVLEPLRNAEAANILRRGNANFGSLSEDEKIQLFGHYGQLFFLAQQLFLLGEEGKVETALVEQSEGVVLTVLGMPGASQWFDQAKHAFVPIYVAHLEDRRRSPDRPPPLNETYPAFMATGEA